MTEKKLYAGLVLLIIGSMSIARAQNRVDVDLTADFVSSTIWRGSYLGGASLQPELAVGWKGLELSAWGSAGIADGRYEIDLTLSYTIGGLSISVVDYWDNTGGTRYFFYKPEGTGHSFEGAIEYDFGPVAASWQTIFAGCDYQEADDRRAFSSYFEISVPFQLVSLEWEAKAGVVPWASDYYGTERFSLKCVSLKATKDIHITEKFVLPLYGELIADPHSRNLYFVAGLTIKAF
jgi:hypothetical protein